MRQLDTRTVQELDDVNNKEHRYFVARKSPFGKSVTFRIAKILTHDIPIAAIESEQVKIDAAWRVPDFPKLFKDAITNLRIHGEVFVIRHKTPPRYFADFQRIEKSDDPVDGYPDNVRVKTRTGPTEVDPKDWLYSVTEDCPIEVCWDIIHTRNDVRVSIKQQSKKAGSFLVVSPGTSPQYNELKKNDQYKDFAKQEVILMPAENDNRRHVRVELLTFTPSEFRDYLENSEVDQSQAVGYPIMWLSGKSNSSDRGAEQNTQAVRRQLLIDFQDYSQLLKDMIFFVTEEKVRGLVRPNIDDLFPDLILNVSTTPGTTDNGDGTSDPSDTDPGTPDGDAGNGQGNGEDEGSAGEVPDDIYFKRSPDPLGPSSTGTTEADGNTF